jgi:hypothetical protein
MKTTNNHILYSLNFLVIVALIGLASCGGGGGDPNPPPPPPSVLDQIKAKMTAATWVIQSVTVDGVDKTDIYKNLTLKFTATTYTTTNGAPVWPASGTWSFTNETGTTVKRDDNTEITVEATDTSLKLGLTWSQTTVGPGRTESVEGQHVFTFKKQ